jgi:hypothetical protein
LRIKRHRSYIVAGIFLAIGIALVAAGLSHDSLPETIAGVSLAFAGQLIACMHIVHGWVTSTAAERSTLHQASQRLEAESAKCAAGKVALDAERDRLRRDRVSAARRADLALQEHRAALDAQFEERKSALVSEAMEAAFLIFQSGGHRAPARERVVVQFPGQLADHERARSRDVRP